jgi:hypothetical protein
MAKGTLTRKSFKRKKSTNGKTQKVKKRASRNKHRGKG